MHTIVYKCANNTIARMHFENTITDVTLLSGAHSESVSVAVSINIMVTSAIAKL